MTHVIPWFRARQRSDPTTAVWREQAIAEIDQTTFTLDCYRDRLHPPCAGEHIAQWLAEAGAAAVGPGLGPVGRIVSALRGASVERTWGHIDAANEALLRAAPEAFVAGQIPRVRRRVQRTLAADDDRRVSFEEVDPNQALSPDRRE